MSFMFSHCTLDNLDLSHFNTKTVNDMNNMFKSFKIITKKNKLDLSELNASNVTNTSYMFCDCVLPDLDLSLFKTQNVENIEGMFYHSKLFSYN